LRKRLTLRIKSSNRCSGGKAVSRVELNDQSTLLSIDNLAQIYFVNGVVGVWAKWYRLQAKRSNGYLTQNIDEQGNFCK